LQRMTGFHSSSSEVIFNANQKANCHRRECSGSPSFRVGKSEYSFCAPDEVNSGGCSRAGTVYPSIAGAAETDYAPSRAEA